MFACLCLSGDFHLEENTSSRAGLMSEFSLVCSACDHTTSIKSSSCVTQRGRSFDVNQRAVYHSLETGGGYEGLSSFCSIMNMPCISKTAYYKQLEIIIKGQAKLTKAGGNFTCDQHQENDAAVSFDGTWAKKGIYISNWSGFCISVVTEVLDYHVLSKTCPKCALKKSQCEEAEMFEEWRIQLAVVSATSTLLVVRLPWQ